MKTAVRYQSRGGNNKMVAEAIGEALGVKAEPVGKGVPGEVDVLFLGGGVYGMQIDEEMQRFLDGLDAGKVKGIVPFACVGIVKVPIRRIKSAARAKGIRVLGVAPVIKLGFSHEAKPSVEKLREVGEFARNIVQ